MVDIDLALEGGADKISTNSAATRNPDLVTDAAKKFGIREVKEYLREKGLEVKEHG